MNTWHTAWRHDAPWQRAIGWIGVAVIAILLLAIAWASWVAPPWGPMHPVDKPTIDIVSADGIVIARRRGRDAPLDPAMLPSRVRDAFIAIEDRRFLSHHGVDPRGLLRAFWHNAQAGALVEGGSTITQQFAKNAFLTADREISRKIKEVVIAMWLEAWLSKDEILSRYLSSIYFGDGIWGLRDAARHYFQKKPDQLSVAEAAMLAGMVKAPSRLNPTHDLTAAQARSRVVLQAMAEEGMISPASLNGIRPATSRPASNEPPAGTYFADWVAPQIEQVADNARGPVTVRTTLDTRLQKAAIRALTSVMSQQSSASHAKQVGLVAMRPDGQVVAMVGGRSYKASPFNRTTQAKRQPGSAFKLAVYFAALENGYTPDTLVENSPISVDGWSPRNYGDEYGPPITVRDAFAQSSNVAAVRIAERVGRGKVAAAAKRLGITSPIAPGPSLALGSSGTTLIELTAAYAAVANGRYPVIPYGLPGDGNTERARSGSEEMHPGTREAMLDLLWTATNQGTGRAASLSIPTFGKTGTTQNHRDALFVGFAGGLVTGVWVGNDDDSPMRGVTGGTLPAKIWQAFMSHSDLTPTDLPIPSTLQSSMDDRIDTMRAAEELERAWPETDSMPEPLEDETGLLRFLERERQDRGARTWHREQAVPRQYFEHYPRDEERWRREPGLEESYGW